MAGKTLDQIYIANPITTNTSTDLIYVAQSPYTPGNDAGITYSNFSAQFLLNSAPLTILSTVTLDASNNFISLKGVADQSYSLQVPTTGFVIVIAAGVQRLVLNPAGTLATGTVTMPASPINGQIIKVSTTQTITALTVSGNAGHSVAGAPTTLAAGTGFSMIYNTSSTTWFITV